jgi:hypothetical protein
MSQRWIQEKAPGDNRTDDFGATARVVEASSKILKTCSGRKAMELLQRYPLLEKQTRHFTSPVPRLGFQERS